MEAMGTFEVRKRSVLKFCLIMDLDRRDKCFILRCQHLLRLYRVSQEEGTELRESVPYVKIYRYNPKHLYPKLNGYRDNGQRKVWSSGGSTHCTLSADGLPHVCPRLLCQITEIPLTLLRQHSTMVDYACHVQCLEPLRSTMT